jgi:hypothetical protein
MSELESLLAVIDGAVDDATAGRPIDDVIGEIGVAVDKALAIVRAEVAGGNQ